MAAIPPARRRIPKLGCHKATGQAVVRLNGHDHYLGRYGSAESKEAYDRAISEWLIRGREENRAATKGSTSPARGANFTLSELILAYKFHTDEIYRSSPTERDKVRLSLRPLRQLYGSSPAIEFGPLALRAVRDRLLSVQKRGIAVGGARQRDWPRDEGNNRCVTMMKICRKRFARTATCWRWSARGTKSGPLSWRAWRPLKP